jgi:hypothetical protein
LAFPCCHQTGTHRRSLCTMRECVKPKRSLLRIHPASDKRISKNKNNIYELCKRIVSVQAFATTLQIRDQIRHRQQRLPTAEPCYCNKFRVTSTFHEITYQRYSILYLIDCYRHTGLVYLYGGLLICSICGIKQITDDMRKEQGCSGDAVMTLSAFPVCVS